VKIVIGLGNPGAEYRFTRHNVGFRVLDELARRWKVAFDHEKYGGLIARATNDGEAVLLVKPLTFMNLSGQCVARAMRYTNSEPAEILVVADDANLPLGKMRFRTEGSDGGHNGLKSIIQSVGTNAFSRLRIGVGRNPGSELVEHVLGTFAPDERETCESMLARAADGVTEFLGSGIAKAMSRYN
jgi:peptidyl-tRNA hydrolase, PTH1 family